MRCLLCLLQGGYEVAVRKANEYIPLVSTHSAGNESCSTFLYRLTPMICTNTNRMSHVVLFDCYNIH